jgi:23S rRNA pseudouridine1911/1915/1917 synthase
MPPAPDDDIDEEIPLSLDGASLLEITLPPDAAGERLDRALVGFSGDLSRARLQALISEGHLAFDGRIITDGKHKARPGLYQLSIPAPIAALPQPQDLSLEVLFEDSHLIVINKRAGMAAHPAPGTPDKTLVNALLFHCGDSLSGIGGVLRPGIVHRLDKDTSGVMVAAKSDAAHKGLSELFSRHDIDRTYEALTRGAPKPSHGTLTTQIGRSSHDRKKMAVLKSGGREATTHYQVLQAFSHDQKPIAAHVKCTLETGRTHQIRVHMAHLGSPCLGDAVYGSGAAHKIITEIVKNQNFNRQALHAAVLGFIHPITAKPLHFEASMPTDMAQVLEAISSML